MHTVNIGKTCFHLNSDLSGEIIINNAPAVQAQETGEREEITAPAADIIEFVLSQMIGKTIDLSMECLEDYSITSHDKIELMAHYTHLVEGLRNLSELFGHGRNNDYDETFSSNEETSEN